MSFFNRMRIGIDIGSTTVKVVVVSQKGEAVFSQYKRHFSEIKETLEDLIHQAHMSVGDVSFSAMMTGSGGVAISDALGIEFIQEVVATANAIETAAPKTDVAIELGGEDSKITFFDERTSCLFA